MFRIVAWYPAAPAAAVLLSTAFIGGSTSLTWVRRAAAYVRGHYQSIIAGAPVLGQNKNPTILMFTDYECPFCRGEHQVLRRYLARRPDVGIAIRNLPLPFHAHAMDGALAAVCANQAERFAEMDDFLFSDASWQEEPNWGTIAAHVGIADTAAFRHCLSSDSAAIVVGTDIALGKRLHITGTPTFVVGGVIVPGSIPERMLDSLERRTSVKNQY